MKRFSKVSLLIVVMIIIVVLGVSYAFFNYQKEGSNNRIVTGNIYLVLEDETTSINLTNIFPMSNESARSRNDNTVSFSVTGYNSSNNVLYYEVLLSLGDSEPNLIRFNDKDLRFDLKLIDENNNETMVVDAGSFNEIQDALLYYEVLGANINTEIVRNYELRMWLSDEVLISDTDPNATYAASGDNALSKHYASVKVAVVGDFGNVVGRITYNNDTPSYQDIYEGKQVILASPSNDEDFLGWGTQEDGEVVYHPGDRVLLTSNTTLYPIYKPTLSRRIKQLCNDSSIDYVKPYTANLGTTMDTYDGRGTEDVCYYTSTTSANLAGQNGNVLFGDYCWQIVRTTDTGGIKLIYNGSPTADHKCTSDSDANYDDNPRPASIGVIGAQGTQKTILSGDKIYGTRFEIFDDSGTKKFRLLNTNTYNWSDSTYQNIISKYTCLNTNDTCTTLYYVGHYQSNTQGSTEKYTIGENDHYSQIGESSFNAYYDSPALVGYMYNDVYTYIRKSNFTASSNVINQDSTSATAAYYYGDKATWNSSTNMYDLTIDDGNGNNVTPTTTIEWQNIRENSQGIYTCRSGTDTSCATVYYIVANVTSTTMYSVALQNNETKDKTVTWTYGTDFTKSGANYILANPDTITISLKDWYTNYNNEAYKNIYVCSDFTSSTCSTMYYIGESSNYKITYNVSTNSYIFGNSVDYQGGSYTILDTNSQDDQTKYQTIWDWYKKYNTINNSHYTCFTNSNTCTSVYYVYLTKNTSAYYIKLENGETVEVALKKMLNYKQNVNEEDANINVYNSSVKGIVDNFYETKLSSTAKAFLDVSVTFCNDRSISEISGWQATNGNVGEALRFPHYYANINLYCVNETDRLSIENSKAQLIYPIGLLMESERELMDSNYAKTGYSYWSLSPFIFVSESSVVRRINPSGSFDHNLYSEVYISNAVRPVLALKSDVKFTGTGTYNDPYVIVGSNTNS